MGKSRKQKQATILLDNIARTLNPTPPPLFMKVLAKNVMELQLQEGTLLTYVDTFTTSKVKNSGKNTGTTLNSLAK